MLKNEIENNVTINIYRTKKDAKRLWQQYCKPKVVWDLWKIREISIDVYKYEIFFVEAKRNGNPVGLLPLVFNSIKKQYEWIGWWSETCKPFTDDPLILDMMLKKVKGKVELEYMDGKAAKLFGKGIKKDADQYIMDLEKYNYSWNNFLLKLKKKKRQNIRRDIRSIEGLNPTFRYNKISDLVLLKRLNIRQMRRKIKLYDDEEISIFETDKNQIKFFRKLFKSAGREYKARIITVLVNKKVVGVDFCLIYKNVYIAMLGGLDIKKMSGIGVYMNYLDIVDAIDHDCDHVDFMMEDHHWKKEWFKGRRRYKYERESLAKKQEAVLVKEKRKIQTSLQLSNTSPK